MFACHPLSHFAPLTTLITTLRTTYSTHLVECADVYAAAERDVFGVEAEDALALQPLLRERVVGRQRRGQHRWHDERQDVQAVQQNLAHSALKRNVHKSACFFGGAVVCRYNGIKLREGSEERLLCCWLTGGNNNTLRTQ